MSGTETRNALRQTVVLGLTASTVTAMSVGSRLLALLLLVPAARLLSLSEFGTFSVALGVAVAVANLVGSAPSDLIATSTTHRPARTRRLVLLAVIGCAVASIVLVLVSATAPAPLRTVLATMATCSGAVAPVLAMSLLRGLGRPLLGAALPFVVLPLGRCAALLVAGPSGTTTADRLLAWLAVIGIGTAALTAFVVMSARHAVAPETAPPARAKQLWPAIGAGTLVSLAWLVLTQTGPLALALFSGPTAAAAVVPTLRLCDALTALGIGFKAAASRRLQSSTDASFPRGTVLLLLSAFVVSSGATCAVAPWAVPALFGAEHRWLTAPALLLLGASGLSVLIAVKVQLLFAVAAYRRLLSATAAASSVAIACALLGVGVAGAVGMAAAMLFATATWFTLLSLPGHGGVRGC